MNVFGVRQLTGWLVAALYIFHYIEHWGITETG